MVRVCVCVCVWMRVDGTGVDMLLFTDGGEYVENDRQNAFHKNLEKKSKMEFEKKKLLYLYA